MNNRTLMSARIFFVLTLISFLSYNIAYPQDSKPTNNAKNTKKVVQEAVGRPDLPGDLTIELGLAYLMNNTVQNMDMNLWSSKTFNIYYQYPFQIGNSGISFNPGFGVGTEKYGFQDDYTLGYATPNNDSLAVVALSDIFSNASEFKKSKINANYFDFPLEFRWHSRKNDFKRSVKVTVGGKIGFLFDSKTKVKYTETGETKIAKSKQKWQLQQIRYGVYGKIGYGPGGLFYYYSISNLFKEDKGPEQTTTNSMIFGLYFALF